MAKLLRYDLVKQWNDKKRSNGTSGKHRPVQVYKLFNFFPIIRRHYFKNFVSHCDTQARILSDAIHLYQQKKRQFLIASDVS